MIWHIAAAGAGRLARPRALAPPTYASPACTSSSADADMARAGIAVAPPGEFLALEVLLQVV